MKEHEIQSIIIEYCDLKKIPVFAIPNGGKRHIGTAIKMKKEGVRSGIPDLFFPIPSRDFHGFFLEVKTEIGKLSVNQKSWIKTLSRNGYLCEVAYGLNDAISKIDSYFKDRDI